MQGTMDNSMGRGSVGRGPLALRPDGLSRQQGMWLKGGLPGGAASFAGTGPHTHIFLFSQTSLPYGLRWRRHSVTPRKVQNPQS